jgi:hypothetical protein
MDNIPIELNKKGEQLLINMLHILIKRMWIEDNVRVEWKTNVIVQVYKNKGDKLQCHCYRGI